MGGLGVVLCLGGGWLGSGSRGSLEPGGLMGGGALGCELWCWCLSPAEFGVVSYLEYAQSGF